MAVRNILDLLNDGSSAVKETFFSQIPIYFDGPNPLAIVAQGSFAKVNDLNVIEIPPFMVANPTVSSEFIGHCDFPPQMLPSDGKIRQNMVYISHGNYKIGCLYLQTNGEIHLSGDQAIGAPFVTGTPNIGLPNGGMIIYSLKWWLTKGSFFININNITKIKINT